MLSKLLWNADADVDKLIEEFTDCYYGAGGRYIREYITLLCDTARREGDHVGFNDKPTHGYLQEKYLELFNKAKEAVRLMRNFIEKGELPREGLNSFFGDWESFGLSRMEEWCSRDTTRRALLRGESVGAMLYEHWTEEGPEIL